VNRALLDWMRQEEQPAADDDDWLLHQPDLSLAIWKAMEATQWRHLPFPGGLLDQPDWLIHDLYIISWRRAVLKDASKSLSSHLGVERDKFGITMGG